MKVYILYSARTDRDVFVEGVFSSYSALITWLDVKVCKVHELGKHIQLTAASAEWFDEQSKDGVYYSYEAFDVIGGHSHKTNTINFD
jgi:hypothetical protein